MWLCIIAITKGKTVGVVAAVLAAHRLPLSLAGAAAAAAVAEAPAKTAALAAQTGAETDVDLSFDDHDARSQTPAHAHQAWGGLGSFKIQH